MPGRDAMPSTIRRSPAKAQRTWIKAHDAAAKEYGDGERAHRTAYAALKHSFEKRGDRWMPKDVKGPSDPRAKETRSAARQGRGQTFGGVDYYGHSKRELNSGHDRSPLSPSLHRHSSIQSPACHLIR